MNWCISGGCSEKPCKRRILKYHDTMIVLYQYAINCDVDTEVNQDARWRWNGAVGTWSRHRSWPRVLFWQPGHRIHASGSWTRVYRWMGLWFRAWWWMATWRISCCPRRGISSVSRVRSAPRAHPGSGAVEKPENVSRATATTREGWTRSTGEAHQGPGNTKGMSDRGINEW